MIATHILMAVPAEGVFDVGSLIAGDLKNLLLTLAGAFVGWLVLKFVVGAKTFSAALIAIVMGFVLFFALENIENPTLKKPLDDTIQQYGIGVVDQGLT